MSAEIVSIKAFPFSLSARRVRGRSIVFVVFESPHGRGVIPMPIEDAKRLMAAGVLYERVEITISVDCDGHDEGAGGA